MSHNVSIFLAIAFAVVLSSSSVRDFRRVGKHSRAEVAVEELDIKGVMKLAMTKGLCKKVIKKKASPADQKLLLKLMQRLAKLTPPHGDHAEWKDRTKELVASCEAVVKGKSGAEARLRKAANCANCHRPHRPRG